MLMIGGYFDTTFLIRKYTESDSWKVIPVKEVHSAET